MVATCGTALGEDHVRVLSRFTDRLVLAFDSDEAGARAAERAFEFHQQYAVDFLVLVLPEGQDPADFVLARGDDAGEAFRALAERAVPLVEYMIDRLMAGADPGHAGGPRPGGAGGPRRPRPGRGSGAPPAVRAAGGRPRRA